MNTQTVFYFGADRGIDGEVSFLEFHRFIGRTVSPVFPGFTLTKGEGYWEGKSEVVRILTIVHDAKQSPLCYHIAEIYRDEFGQSAVLVTIQSIDAKLV